MAHANYLSPKCKEREFEIQQIKSEDVRLNPKLMRFCKESLQKYCKSSQGAESMKCLMSHKDEQDVPDTCRSKLLDEGIKQAKNIR